MPRDIITLSCKWYWTQDEIREAIGEDWKKDADRVWNIPLYPLGELNYIEYAMSEPNDIEVIRARTFGMWTQCIFEVVATAIFMRNIIKVCCLARRGIHRIIARACIIQASLGLVHTIISLTSFVPNGASCRTAIWVSSFAAVAGSICVNLALLHLAYIVNNHNRLLLVIGTVAVLPQLVLIYASISSPVVPLPNLGCIMLYPDFMPWLKLALDAPINVILMVIVTMVIYQQYQKYGTKAWKRIVDCGIRTIGLICICDIFCMAMAGFKIFGVVSHTFFIVNWILTSTLLVHHCLSISRATSEHSSHRRPVSPPKVSAVNQSTSFYLDSGTTSHLYSSAFGQTFVLSQSVDGRYQR
jgi:hypothetical protein